MSSKSVSGKALPVGTGAAGGLVNVSRCYDGMTKRLPFIELPRVRAAMNGFSQIPVGGHSNDEEYLFVLCSIWPNRYADGNGLDKCLDPAHNQLTLQAGLREILTWI